MGMIDHMLKNATKRIVRQAVQDAEHAAATAISREVQKGVNNVIYGKKSGGGQTTNPSMPRGSTYEPKPAPRSLSSVSTLRNKEVKVTVSSRPKTTTTSAPMTSAERVAKLQQEKEAAQAVIRTKDGAHEVLEVSSKKELKYAYSRIVSEQEICYEVPVTMSCSLSYSTEMSGRYHGNAEVTNELAKAVLKAFQNALDHISESNSSPEQLSTYSTQMIQEIRRELANSCCYQYNLMEENFQIQSLLANVEQQVEVQKAVGKGPVKVTAWNCAFCGTKTEDVECPACGAPKPIS